MKTKYKWIEFVQFPDGLKSWNCFNGDDDILGEVDYCNGWRQYVFAPSEGYTSTYFNFKCLEDIADFLKQLNKTKGCYKDKE